MNKKLLLSVAFAAATMAISADNAATPTYLWGHILAETTGTSNGLGAYDVVTTTDAVYTSSSFYTTGTDASAATLLWNAKVIAYGAPNSNKGGNPNVLITKLDKKGNVQWHVYSNMGKVNEARMATTSDGGVVVVSEIDHTNSDENKNGILVRFVNADATTTQIDKEYVSGTSGTDIVVFKLTAAGKMVWTKVLTVNETSPNLLSEAIAVDESDNIYLAGYHWDAIKVGDTEIVAKSNGEKTSSSAADCSDFIIKLDKDGNYVRSIASGGTFKENQCYAITYADGALYVLGLAKTAAETDAITLGDKSFVPGSTISTYYTAKLTTALEPQWVKSYYSTTTFTNSKTGALVKKAHAKGLCYIDGKLYFMGSMNGGIATDAKSSNFFSTTKDAYTAFYGVANATDGTLTDARLTNTTNISEYYYVTVKGGKTYVVGYDFSNGSLLSEFTDTESTDYYLGSSTGVSQTAVIDGTNVFASIRGKKTFTMIDGTKLTTNVEKWAITWGGYDFSQLAGVNGVVADSQRIIAVGVEGAVRIIAGEGIAKTVTVYNATGQVVKTAQVSGTTDVTLPAGFYIVEGNKVVVR